MKIFTKAVSCAAVCLVAIVPWTVAGAQNYLLRCRGPINYAVGTGQQVTVVFIVKNATSSGDRGVSLQPGTCAWTDRKIRDNEPAKIYWYPENLTRVRASFIAFTACAGTSTCVVEFLAHNANNSGDPNFRIDDQYARIYYPVFP
jgi:hypothetical protein